MKVFDIALKDMTRSFRSVFAVVFMFGVPLLMTGLFYLMFGGTGGGAGFSVPVTTVAVANLDQGAAAFNAVKAQLPAGDQQDTMGKILVTHLQEPGFEKILKVTLMDTAAEAYAAVDTQKAGAAIIIPADFTSAYSDLARTATIELYKDPTLTIGPGIVQSALNQVMDGLAGSRIAVSVVTQISGQSQPAVINNVVHEYLQASQNAGPAVGLMNIEEVSNVKTQSNLIATIIGPIMGWVTIFYAFYTGATAAQSILKEDEEGTLPRLFTTPTPHATILGGKFLAVGLTVAVQMAALFLLGRYVFGIVWGAFLPVALVVLGAILAASSFGIFMNSLLKDTKASGLIFGGLLTVLGMIGGLPVFLQAASASDTISKIALTEPVGWAVRGMMQNMKSASLAEVGLTTAVLALWAVVFFIIGILRFRRRYA